MTDKRELILARLKAVLDMIPEVEQVLRNDVIVAESKLPAIMLLDGDETTSEDSQFKNRPPASVYVETVMPEIYILIDEPPETVGPALNKMKYRIVRAVLSDAELMALAKDRGIRYDGAQSGLALGRSLAGEMGLEFSIDYVFDVNDDAYPESTE